MIRAPKARAEALARSGFAVLVVLFVLLALLVLCAPFLMASRNVSRASSELSQSAQMRVALDSASRLARAQLGLSHQGVDTTPYSDSLAELDGDVHLDPAQFQAVDARGVMWSVDAGDAAAKIDLSSAPPQVFANVLAAATRTTMPVDAAAKEIPLASALGLRGRGLVYVGSELILYKQREGTALAQLERGVGSKVDSDGKPLECGPQPASIHEPGTPVLDQRAFAPVAYRMQGPPGELRPFLSTEDLAQASQFAVEGLDSEDLSTIARLCSVWAGSRGAQIWQRPTRLYEPLQAGTSCRLALETQRWMAPGTTVLIDDGRTRELALVMQVEGGSVLLAEAVANDYPAYTTHVSALIRAPVNLNAANEEVLVALFANLQLAGRNARITRDEARLLAEVVVQSRPLAGFEDFLRRVVLPAAGLEPLPKDAPSIPSAFLEGGAMLDSSEDAAALYLNGLNANDSRLAFSTMPYSFVSRDLHHLELRAAVNAPSGAIRQMAVRDEVILAAPQTELLRVWARQEDFDEELRLGAEAPWWTSGPESTTRFDSSAIPPSRFHAHFGTQAGSPFAPWSGAQDDGSSEEPPTVEHVFASREDDGFVQLWPERVAEFGLRRGKVLHFDHETRDPEGRWLPDQPEKLALGDPKLDWRQATPEQLLRPFNLSTWFRLRSAGDAFLLDMGTGILENDRVSLGLEGTDLVLRVYDAAGDHPGTTGMIEVAEARLAISPGAGSAGATPSAGIPLDTWMHVFLDVRGTRPDQITMLIDGRALGVRVPGRARLASDVTLNSATVALDSAEGFPNQGVARIGDELIEFTRTGNTLQVLRNDTGPNAGFGGRLAREVFDMTSTGGVAPGVNGGLAKNTSHPAGTMVQLYGYSLPVASLLSNLSTQTQAPLGAFRVGYVRQVQLQNSGSPSPGEPIIVRGDDGLPDTLGLGIEGEDSQVTSLFLGDPEVAGGQVAGQDVMSAFHPQGGYLALLQNVPYAGGETLVGTPLGYVEIVQYSGVDAAAGRIDLVPGSGRGLAGTTKNSEGWTIDWVKRAFVVQFEDLNFVQFEDDLAFNVFVVPISIPAQGVSAGTGFLNPEVTQKGSEFAQLTHVQDPVLTEWVRYDKIENNHLVRCEAQALKDLYEALTQVSAPPAPAAPLASAAVPQNAAQEQWLPTLGAAEPGDFPVTRAAQGALQFRGVLGTYSHAHPVGTLILPVWRVPSGGVDEGRPGRGDYAWLVTETPGSNVKFPVRVHRSYQPRHYEYRPYSDGMNNSAPVSGTSASPPPAEKDFDYLTYQFVALDAPAPVPFFPSQPTSVAASAETRVLNRLIMHPSGELPRQPLKLVLGSSHLGGGVPSATIDEVVFGRPTIGEVSSIGETALGGQFVLIERLSPGQFDLQLAPNSLRMAKGQHVEVAGFLNSLRPGGGLLRIGNEILAYTARDPGTGVVTIPQGGRGLLGTEEVYHQVGETATALESFLASELVAAISADDALIPVAAVGEFPFQGSVLIDGELIHYTHAAGALEMPRRSATPGARDARGGGIFRGRYGTAAAAHAAGAVVIEFPVRYPDRWSERSDGPELAYFGFELAQPNAFLRSCFWQAEEPASGASRIEFLQRLDLGPGTNVPWDGDPGQTPGLSLLTRAGDSTRPKDSSLPHSIGESSSRAQWRAYVRYNPGAFDAQTGLSHGWKETPRLSRFAVDYLAPEQVLYRVQR